MVFDAAEQPVLIDPDHAGKIPRLYDLACALLLFHGDQKQGPHRLWNLQEWNLFLRGYRRHVTLTLAELAAWPAALASAWLNEGLWLLAHFPEGWANKTEAAYLENLFLFKTKKYPLFDSLD